MAIDFPNSPTVNDTYTAGGKTWQWTGTYWSAYGTSPILRASDTAPLSPNANDLWYETDTGSLFAYVDGYWVELGASAPVTASAGDLTGATLASNVVSSSLTSVGTLGSLAVTGATTSGSFVQGTDYLSPYQGFRNKIINGSFEFWQRGTARTFMQAGQYLADRWTIRLYQNGSHQRTTVTPVTGMQTRYALRVGSVTTAEAGGGARMWANTELESGDSIPLRGKTMTLSFWVRFSSATCSSSTATAFGNWSGSVDWCTSTTDAAMSSTASNGGSGVTLTNGSLPTTWTKYTTTVTLPSNINNVGVQFGFAGLGNTASADTVWYEVTQVQLEEGSVATPFEQRPLQTELALCQRYYYKTFPNIAAKSFGVATISTSTRAHVSGFFPVTMRVIPTALEQSGTANQFMLSVSSTNFVCSVVPSHSVSTTANTWVALFDVASGLTTGQAGRGLTHVTYGASAYLAWSAEL